MKKLWLVMFAFVVAGFVAARSFGDAEVIGFVSSPGWPENGAVDGATIYVGTPGTPNAASIVTASKLRRYNLTTGALLAEWPIAGENLTAPHGLFGIALDAVGRVYMCEQQGQILRIDPTTGVQTTYATLPDLHPCSATPAPCSPTATDQGAFPDDLVFDAVGNMYVTDIFQATIWKIAPGGGAPSIWYQDARFDGASGANGIRFDPSRSVLYFTLSAPASTLLSGVYKINAVSAPTAADLSLVRAYVPGPDGLSVGASGKLYVALPFTNALVVVDPATGNETARILGPAHTGLTVVPFDTPTSATFRGTSVIVTNNSIAGNPATTALFDVYVGEKGDPLEYPTITP